MLLAGYSYSTVGKWARHNFLDDYDQLPVASKVIDQLHKVPGCKRGLLRGIVIGTTHDDQNLADVLAWLDGSGMIVGYISNVAGCLQYVQYDSRNSLFQGVRCFKDPFSWVCEGGDQDAFERLEALVRFYFLRKGFASAVKDNHHNFASNFRKACRFVAAKGEEDKASYPQIQNARMEITPQPSPYSFEKFVDELADTPIDTKQADEPFEHPQTHTSNVRTDSHLETRRPSFTNDLRTMTEAPKFGLANYYVLNAEIRALRLKLENVDGLRLLAERRSRIAENEAALWKGSYEQLRKRG